LGSDPRSEAQTALTPISRVGAKKRPNSKPDSVKVRVHLAVRLFHGL